MHMLARLFIKQRMQFDQVPCNCGGWTMLWSPVGVLAWIGSHRMHCVAVLLVLESSLPAATVIPKPFRYSDVADEHRKAPVPRKSEIIERETVGAATGSLAARQRTTTATPSACTHHP